MNFTNVQRMMTNFGKVLDRPTQVPSPAAMLALLRDYMLPIMQELTARSMETAEAVVSTNELAQSAFVTARQTLAGDLMSQIADTVLSLREAITEALPAEHPAFELLDQVDSYLVTFEEYLLNDEGDGEGEGEGEEGEEGDEDEGGQDEQETPPVVDNVSPASPPVVVETSAPVIPVEAPVAPAVIDVVASVTEKVDPEG